MERALKMENMDLEWVRGRVHQIVLREFGRVEEELMRNGIIDSLKAIEVALILEKEFGVQMQDLSIADMVTVSSLSVRIHAIATEAGTKEVGA